MDELELIRELRDGEPDEVARARARAALMQVMDAPAPAELGGRRSRRRPRTRWLALPAAVATAVVLAIALGPGSGEDGGGPLGPATAQAALEQAARSAQARPEPPLAPGQYFYVRSRDAYLHSMADGDGNAWSALVPAERESWTDREGNVRYTSKSAGEPTFPGPRDRAGWEAAGKPNLGGHAMNFSQRSPQRGFTAGATSVTYEQLLELPSDGEAMYRKLIEFAKDAGPSPDEEAFVIIGDLLRTVPVPAKARAGLYRAAAFIKGVRYVGEVKDELGRPGLAVELNGHKRLVFDPDTSQVLVEQDVLTERLHYADADQGFVGGYRLVLQQGVVDSDTARP